jgi:rare lipoprotein A
MKAFLMLLAVVILVFLFFTRVADSRPEMNTGSASWYGPGLYGNHMACGGRLYPSTIGVAHKFLRCGTRVKICLRRCIYARVVDRGPYVAGRDFDLTAATAQAVGLYGVARVRWCVC